MHFEVRKIGDRPAAALPQDAEILELLRAVDRHLGIRTEIRLASTDANIPLSLGIEALSIGAGGDGGGVHTYAEWYDSHNRELGLRRSLLLLLALADASAERLPREARALRKLNWTRRTDRNMSEKLRAHLLLLGVVAVWGSTFVLVKDALSDISPLLFNLIRMALATLCLAVVYRKHLRRMTPRGTGGRRDCRLLPGRGISVPDGRPGPDYPVEVCVSHRIDSHHRSFALCRSRLARSWRVAPRLECLRRGAGRAGGNHTDDRARGLFSAQLCRRAGTGINLGDLLTLVCALSFAFHLISLAHLAKRIPFEQLALLQIGFCTLVMARELAASGTAPAFTLTARLVVALLVAAVLATAAAFTIQSWAQQHLAATHTALILSAEPLFAWITSLLVPAPGTERTPEPWSVADSCWDRRSRNYSARPALNRGGCLPLNGRSNRAE